MRPIFGHGLPLRAATSPSRRRNIFASLGTGNSDAVQTLGDRYDRKGKRPPWAELWRGKPPPQIIAWGLGSTAGIGHNNGPPIDEEPGYLWRRYRWKKAHAEAWRAPSMGILKFRVSRAEAAGISYEDYMLELLDTGRHLQADDVAKRRK